MAADVCGNRGPHRRCARFATAATAARLISRAWPG
jgi:hypothetical protein